MEKMYNLIENTGKSKRFLLGDRKIDVRTCSTIQYSQRLKMFMSEKNAMIDNGTWDSVYGAGFACANDGWLIERDFEEIKIMMGVN